MPGAIKETATEKGSFKITFVFKDESGNSVAPDVMAWTLTDLDGSVMNSKTNVSISSPSSEESILLQGDDLAIDGNDPVQRLITAQGTYTSAELGAGLPLIDQSEFTIIPVKIV